MADTVERTLYETDTDPDPGAASRAADTGGTDPANARDGGRTAVMVLLDGFWPGLAGAAALGLLVGALAGWPARPTGPLALCGLAALLAAIAVLGIVPGLPGLWLEGAALLLPAYCSGCALGALGRRLVARS